MNQTNNKGLDISSIHIQCPAKINLTLEVVNRREDGFHNIKSIMQLISLYDYLDMSVEDSNDTVIRLSGVSTEIPYNSTNLVYKAADLFMQELGKNAKIRINIDKNIPVAAGLAGGSTDAAGTLFGLNELFNKPFTEKQLHDMCAKLGSDLNVCLKGGCLLASGRGENIRELQTLKRYLTLIKPKNLGISAKEAYTKYSQKANKPHYNMTEKMLSEIETHGDIEQYLYNDLEYAVFDDYEQLRFIKSKLPESVMSGSGSTYFVLKDDIEADFGSDYQVIKHLKFISEGVSIA